MCTYDDYFFNCIVGIPDTAIAAERVRRSVSFIRCGFSRKRNDVTTRSWISTARGVRMSVAGVDVTCGLTNVGARDGNESHADDGVSAALAKTRRDRMKRAMDAL